MKRLEAQRGQALIETAMFMPLFLMLLFGMLWAIQVSVVNERAQVAVRYSGLVSNEANPFDGYSLYSVYNNVGAYSQSASTTCATPPPDAFSNNPANGAFPGPVSQPFWTPQSTSGSCNEGRVGVTGGGITVPMLLLGTFSSASAQKQTTTNMPSQISELQNNSIFATQNFLNTPDVASLMQCFPTLHTNVSASLVGEQSASSNPTATSPLPAINSITPLTLQSC